MKNPIKTAAIATLMLTAAAFSHAQGPSKPAADGTIKGIITADGCIAETTGAGVNVTFLSSAQKWCKAVINGPFDLTGYTGIEAKVTNIGTVASKISVRADNPGSVNDKPWNMGVAPDEIKPGETFTLRIDFGYNNFKAKVPSYPLNPANISQVMLTMGTPAQDVTFRLDSLKAVK